MNDTNDDHEPDHVTIAKALSDADIGRETARAFVSNRVIEAMDVTPPDRLNGRYDPYEEILSLSGLSFWEDSDGDIWVCYGDDGKHLIGGPELSDLKTALSEE